MKSTQATINSKVEQAIHELGELFGYLNLAHASLKIEIEEKFGAVNK
jgi:hypothetical protein